MASSGDWRQAKIEAQRNSTARFSFSTRSTTAEIHPQKAEKIEAPTVVSSFTAKKNDAKSDVQECEESSDSDSSSESLSGFGELDEDERPELAIQPLDAQESHPPTISVIVPEVASQKASQPKLSRLINALPSSVRSSLQSLPRISMTGSSSQKSPSSRQSDRSSTGKMMRELSSNSLGRRTTTQSTFSQNDRLERTERSEIWHEVHQTVYDCITRNGSYQDKFFTLRRMLKRRWRDYSFFGVNRNDRTPRVWGHRMIADKSTNAREMLSRMVANHEHHDEMRLQLRCDSVRLQYLDAFRTDCEPEGWLIRVFSPGASLMEYIKLVISVWTFLFSLMVVAFWKVMRPLYQEALIIDCVVDVVYAFLLALQLRTTILKIYVGKEVCGKRKIFDQHIRDWRFWADVVSCIPMFLCLIFTGDERDAPVWVVLVKALRGWRISRLPPKHRFIPSMSFLVFRISLGMLMFGHFLACIWFTLVYELEGTVHHHIQSEDPRFQECASATEPPNGCTYRLYSVSINQGIYLLMGVDRSGFSALEHFFLTVCMPVGALVHAYVFGEMILLVQRTGALETRRNEHTLAIQEAMRILGLSPSLQVRIITYFTFERLNRCGGLFNELFTDLSPQLRFELQLQLYLDLVVQSGLFKNMRPRVIREIVVHLQDLIFLPGDWICRYGDYGDSMYFIVTGSCNIIAKDTVTVMRELGHGCYFGEVALLTGVPRTAYVLASTFCIVAHLTKEVFEPIVKKWPEEIDNLLQGVEKDTDKLKIREEAARYYNLPSANPVPGRRVSVAGRRESGVGLPGPRLSRRASETHIGRSSARVSTSSFMMEDVPGIPRRASGVAGDAAGPAQQVQQEQSPRPPPGAPRLSRGMTAPVRVEDDQPANDSHVSARRLSPCVQSLMPSGMAGIVMPTGALTRQVMQTAMEQSMQAETFGNALLPQAAAATLRSTSPTTLRTASFSAMFAPAEDRKAQEDLERQRSEHEALVKERDSEVESLELELTDLLEAVAKLDNDVHDQRKFLTLSLSNLKKSVFENCREAVSAEVARLGSMGMEDTGSVSGSSAGMLEAMVI